MYEIYNIPSHKNCQNCGACCGLIPVNPQEVLSIQTFLAEYPDVKERANNRRGHFECPFRNEQQQRCDIYPVRPIICRLMGIVNGMECKHGNSAAIAPLPFLQGHSPDTMLVLNALIW